MRLHRCITTNYNSYAGIVVGNRQKQLDALNQKIMIIYSDDASVCYNAW